MGPRAGRPAVRPRHPGGPLAQDHQIPGGRGGSLRLRRRVHRPARRPPGPVAQRGRWAQLGPAGRSSLRVALHWHAPLHLGHPGMGGPDGAGHAPVPLGGRGPDLAARGASARHAPALRHPFRGRAQRLGRGCRRDGATCFPCSHWTPSASGSPDGRKPSWRRRPAGSEAGRGDQPPLRAARARASAASITARLRSSSAPSASRVSAGRSASLASALPIIRSWCSTDSRARRCLRNS